MIRVKGTLHNYHIRSDVHTYPTRNNFQIDMPKVRLTKTKRFHEVLGITMFNRLPVEAHFVNYKRFKSVLHQWLTSNPFYNVNEFLDSKIDICF